MCSHCICTTMKAINSITLWSFLNTRNLLHCDMKKGPLALYKSGKKLINVKHFQKDTWHLPLSRSPIKAAVFVLLSLCDFPSSCPTTATCATPSSLSYTFLEQLITLNSKPFSLFCSLLLCHVWCGWEAGLWASWGSAQSCCCISPFMVSAFIQKPGKAVALLPVQNAGSSQGNCAVLKGGCVFSGKHVQNIDGWEPSEWSGLCWARGCILSPRTLCAADAGLCGMDFLAVLGAAVFGCCLPQNQVIWAPDAGEQAGEGPSFRSLVPTVHLAPQLCWASSAPRFWHSPPCPRLATGAESSPPAATCLLFAFQSLSNPCWLSLCCKRSFGGVGSWVRSSCCSKGSGFSGNQILPQLPESNPPLLWSFPALLSVSLEPCHAPEQTPWVQRAFHGGTFPGRIPGMPLKQLSVCSALPWQCKGDGNGTGDGAQRTHQALPEITSAWLWLTPTQCSVLANCQCPFWRRKTPWTESWDAREEECFARGVGFLIVVDFFPFFFGFCLVLVCPEGFFRVVVGTGCAVSNVRSFFQLELVFTRRNP